MYKIFLFLILFFVKSVLFSQNNAMDYDYVVPNNNDFKIYALNGKYGFLNKSGKKIIPPIYDAVSDYSNGVFLVQLGGYTGAIDTLGNIILPIKYRHVGPYSNGLFSVNFESINFGYISPKGREFRVKGMSCGNFSEGVAPVGRVGVDQRFGYIDSLGREITPKIYDSDKKCMDGLIEVSINWKSGVINKEGIVILPVIFSNIEIDYKNKLIYAYQAPVVTIYNYDGEVMINPMPSESFKKFTEGISGVKRNGKWGYINKLGETIIPFEYDKVFNGYNKGFAAVCKDDKWGFIDKNNKTICPFIYQDIIEIDTIANTAIVKKSNKIGIISIRDNKELVPFQYDKLKFYFDKIVVQNGKKMGVIDYTNKNIIPIQYDSIVTGYFKRDFYTVRKGNQWGIVNSDNKILAPIIYDEEYIEVFEKDSQIITKLNNKKGLINFEHKVLLPFEFDYLQKEFLGGFMASRYKNDVLLMKLYNRDLSHSTKEYPIIQQNSSPFGYKVKINNQLGFVDKNLKEIISPEYHSIDKVSNVEEFDESNFRYLDLIFALHIDGTAMFFDLSGQKKIPEGYGSRGQFFNGICAVFKNGKVGMINTNCELVIPCEYDEINFLDRKKTLYIRKQTLTGVMNSQGQWLAELDEYKAINYDEINKKVIIVDKNDKIKEMTIKKE